MCGFAGEFLLAPGRADLELCLRLSDILRHRGPDDQGGFLSADGRCAIGFCRLAVIDPPLSRQPMSLDDLSLTVAFNGEIYNFRELRRQLEDQGAKFQTGGDTEVLLHLYKRDGTAMLAHLEGMFSFAIFDAHAGKLCLARDRLGEKPLWYSVLSDRIVFASEAKALLNHPGVRKTIDAQSLTYYLSLGYIPAPRSAWTGIRKLQPGSVLVVQDTVGQPKRYWQPSTTALPQSPQDILSMVREQLASAVAQRMVSDVPLGALLSGGLDSSIIVALMAKQAGKAGGVRTFTAGFSDAAFDERPAARIVAEHCGTDHAELVVSTEGANLRGMLDDLVGRYDEPFADSSAIPTYQVCKAAREHVTVALTGDGGDEAFGGYDRYRALHLADTLGPLGFLGVKVGAAMARLLAPKEERSHLRRLVRFAGGLTHPFATQYFTYRSLFNPADLARLLKADWIGQENLSQPFDWFSELFEQGEFSDEVSRAQQHDLLTYLPDDLLVKSDIASMACSLELRAPILDHRIVELGLSLPVNMKVRGGRGKDALREAFSDLLPQRTLSSPKRGFGVPLGRWLRRDLAVQMQEILLDRKFLAEGILEPRAVHGLVNDHVRGRDDHRHKLWALLVLARWMAKYGV